MESELKDQKSYEIGFLGKGANSGEEALRTLTKAGADVFHSQPVQELQLAYPVKKQTIANFGYFHFRVTPDAIRGIEDELKLNSEILRVLIITPPFVKAKPRMSQKPMTKAPTQPAEPSEGGSLQPLSNEALEKKIEEILQE